MRQPARPQLSVVFGPSRPDLVRDETLVDMFAATARDAPYSPALSLLGDRRTLNYHELDTCARRVAAGLVARGIRPGDKVGLWLTRSLELHVALLGILMAGAAYIPFDAEAPVARIDRCLKDCDARALLTDATLAGAAAGLRVAVIDVADLLAGASAASLPAPRADDLAYLIYTSGSTGEPKGIAVSHRNVCHYVRSVNETLGVRDSDTMLQQASVAFDLSIEEIFVPYLVGARIKVATAESLRQADRLADIIEGERITVVDTVPTLLAMLDRRPATVRLFIVGGEACPAAIVERYSAPGCRLLNTYGPTETTVVATAVELTPGDPVTIGTPIANYTAYVVDESLQLVPPGVTGELLIGGPSVTRGYVGRPDLTAAKFIANPFLGPAATDPLLYRSGDAVSIDDEGRIAFHGRIDAQIKIRGYRIELGEIEAVIQRQPGVQTAAVVATPLGAAGDVLVAHVVADERMGVEPLKLAVAAELPAYMVPVAWRRHEDLPRLASGKVDRKALSALPVATEATTSGAQEPPRTLTEGHLLKAAREILGLPVVDFDADFFTGLGGHSLLAAQFVSEVRKIPHLSGIALQDVYMARTLRRLADLLDERTHTEPLERADHSFVPPPWWRRFLCGLAQAIALPFIIAIVTLQWIGLLLTSIYLIRENTPFWEEVFILGAVYVSLNLGAKLLIIALKWLIIGRTRPGIYPLWGAYYFRLWCVQRLIHLTSHKFLQGSPLMRIYLRLLGAKVGRDAIIGEFEEGAIDLISIGERASIGAKVRFANAEVIGGEIHVGRIAIGAGAHVGNACVLGVDTVIGAGAELGDMTALADRTTVAPGERWDGSPARRAGQVEPDTQPHPEISSVGRAARTLAYFVAYCVVMMVGLLPIFPAFYILSHINGVAFGAEDHNVPWAWLLPFAWPAALALVFVSMAVVIAMRWLLFPTRVKPGRYSIHSGFYFRKWTMSLATEAVLETLNSLYATVFMRSWYRLMGTRVGRGTEISANFSGRYDLIELGAHNFIGDETIFGDEDVRNGWMHLARVKTGDRCFFGNFAVVAPGSTVEDDALLGVKSRMPDSLHIRAHETWFGSPAIAIPNRQKVELAATWTYEPPWRMRLARTVFEALHTSLPTAVLIALAYVTADVIEAPLDDYRWGTALAIFMAAGIVVSLVMCLVSVLFKWLAMGIYRPGQHPMWSWWAMRTEAVAVLYGGLSSKIMLDYVRGTPFLPWLLRLYGAKVGRGCWINCTDLTEFDCVRIGDYAAINMFAVPQTHLYEDRVMKVGRIDIGRGVTLGSGSVVLYDTRIGDYARIMPLTVVMKGELVPPHTVWAGAPSRRVVDAQLRGDDPNAGTRGCREGSDSKAKVA